MKLEDILNVVIPLAVVGGTLAFIFMHGIEIPPGPGEEKVKFVEVSVA